MPRPTKTAACDVCAHHEPITGSSTEVQCRLFPPTTENSPLTGTIIVRHPIVPARHWCGQFKRPRGAKQ